MGGHECLSCYLSYPERDVGGSRDFSHRFNPRPKVKERENQDDVVYTSISRNNQERRVQFELSAGGLCVYS